MQLRCSGASGAVFSSTAGPPVNIGALLAALGALPASCPLPSQSRSAGPRAHPSAAADKTCRSYLVVQSAKAWQAPLPAWLSLHVGCAPAERAPASCSRKPGPAACPMLPAKSPPPTLCPSPCTAACQACAAPAPHLPGRHLLALLLQPGRPWRTYGQPLILTAPAACILFATRSDLWLVVSSARCSKLLALAACRLASAHVLRSLPPLANLPAPPARWSADNCPSLNCQHSLLCRRPPPRKPPPRRPPPRRPPPRRPPTRLS